MDKIHLDLRGTNSNIFFTSDLHFGHHNIISFCRRPFSDCKEMRSGLIEMWNSVVSKEDYVFQLGDFYWFDSSRGLVSILSNLNGSIFHIMGNHDMAKAWRNISVLSSIVHLSVSDDIGFHRFVLSHYPLLTWQGRERGVFNLHGHIHRCKGASRTNPDFQLEYSEYHYDVGVDNNFLKPVSYKNFL